MDNAPIPILTGKEGAGFIKKAIENETKCAELSGREKELIEQIKENDLKYKYEQAMKALEMMEKHVCDQYYQGRCNKCPLSEACNDKNASQYYLQKAKEAIANESKT